MEAEGRAPREKDKFVSKFDAIIRRSISAGRPDFVDETGHGMQEIGARDNADHLVIFDDRQPLDMVSFHEPHGIGQRRLGRYRAHIVRHDVANFATAEPNVLIGKLARADEEFDPPRPLAFGADFRAAQEVAFGDDADQISAIINDRKSTDFLL